MENHRERVIEAVKVTKVYREGLFRKMKVLNDTTFNVYKGEVFGLLGPNGSGKTTLIKMLTGLTRPDKGKIRVLGGSIYSSKIRRNIGYVSELPYLYREFTPEETVRFFAGLCGMTRRDIDGRCREVLDICGLKEVKDRLLSTFPKGMLQRVNLAAGLVHDPELLILDEPMLGLDPVGADMVGDIIKRLKGRGKTLLITSHVLESLDRILDRVGFLKNGQVIEIVDRASLKDRKTTHLVIKNFPSASLTMLDEFIKGNGGSVTEIYSDELNLKSLFVKLYKTRER